MEKHQLGQASSYEILKQGRAESSRYMKNKYPTMQEMWKYVPDHLNRNSHHRLVGFDRDSARCISTTKILNESKEYAKKGQKLPFSVVARYQKCLKCFI